MKSAALLLLLGMIGRGAVSYGEFVIQDRGQPRLFEVATDEIHIGRRPERVPPQPTLAAIRAVAAARGGGLVLYEVGAPRNEYTRRLLTDAVLVQRAGGWEVQRVPAGTDALEWAAQLRRMADVLAAEPLLAKQQQKKFFPNDTYFTNQWHLLNTGQGGGTPGVDVNVTNVWDSYRGSNVVIGIVDDGLQWSHPDLTNNYVAALSWDFNDNDPDPSPNLKDDPHGTACAGVAAACGNNGIGVSGAAMQAQLAGLRLVALPTTDADEANGLSFSNAAIVVKSNSWGPEDDGRTLEGPGPLTQAALSNAVANGRNGKGVIFTWAGGNGLSANDNANYDGYANSIYTIAVGAVSDQGLQASYSEPGACLVVVAPSSSAGRQGITTTDLVGKNGYNSTGPTDYPNRDYTKTFGGTSSATPLVAGVCALLLQANPELGWRDVQEILIRSATRIAPGDADWCTNSAGFRFNHKFGAGLVNAGAAVALATNWVNLGPQQQLTMTQSNLALAIPDNNSNGVTIAFNCVGCRLRVEHAVVTVNITHPYRGDLAVTLTSPSGMASRLAERHSDPGDNYVDWPLMSVRHWGESAAGVWSVRIADLAAADTGRVNSVRLDLYGTFSNAPPVVTEAMVEPEAPDTLTDLVAVASASDPDDDPVTLFYQWQQSADGIVFTDLVGQVTATLPAAATAAGQYYRVIVTPHDGYTNGMAVSTEPVLVAEDSDSDGLNDDWELEHFGGLEAAAQDDPDGDGFSNLQEQAAGTDPRDAASALRVACIELADEELVIRFDTAAGRSYAVEHSDDLTLPDNWVAFTNVAGTGGPVTITDPAAAALSQRFYRIRLLQ